MSTKANKAPEATDSKLRAVLAEGRAAGRSARVLRWALGIALIVALAAWWFLRGGNSESGAGRYVTEAAAVGDLMVTASASGTLQPTQSVDVGSELSGTVAAVLVDENAVVRQNQVLARLDTAKLADAVARSEAAVAAAEAAVAQARATQAEARAQLARMRQVAELSGGKVPARTELDAAEAAVQRAEANEASARANVAQARATLKTDQTNLGKAEIRSPVNGVVLTRKVEPGNTVVAAMNAPVLFTIAEDLAKMDLQVKVDEADVASVKPGQEVSFTVAAWPGRRFPASILRVGLGSTITDNVVTYKTLLRVDNRDLALRPGMTATATIVTARRSKVLLVPNAALRYVPPAAAAADADTGGGILSRLMPRPPPRAPRSNALPQPGGTRRVWVQGSGTSGPRAVNVEVGVSDGRHTEVTGGDLRAGTPVIVDYEAPKS